MGYAYPVYGQVWEIGSSGQGGITTLDTTVQNWDIGLRFTIPTAFKGKILGSYMDLYFPQITNTAASANYITATTDEPYVRLFDTSTGISKISHSDLKNDLWCREAASSYPMGRIWGDTDMGVLAKGHMYEADLMNVKSIANNLIIENSSGVLRLYIV